MHVCANTAYEISGFIYGRLITSFTNFVFLFMVISAFGMCCGYFGKVIHNQISPEAFYAKRYSKILPFFALLVVIDIAMSPSKAAFIEGIADITLLFGLFPNEISVIGVGWFLGLIFAFYLIFPFYCVLIKTRKRAWGAFGISLALNYICGSYFGLGRTNIVYSLCYLLAGGLIYLYRDEAEEFGRKHGWISLGLVAVTVILYFMVGANTITMLLVSSSLLIYAIGRNWNRGGVLANRFTKFVSTVSMEVYLSHMVIFRAVEKVGIHKMVGNGWGQYMLTVVVVLVGTVLFAVIVQRGLEMGGERMMGRRKGAREG